MARPQQKEGGRHLEEDRAGGTAEMSRHRGGTFQPQRERGGGPTQSEEEDMDSGGWQCGRTAPVARLH